MSERNVLRDVVAEENFVERLASVLVEEAGSGSKPERIRKLYNASVMISAALGRKMQNIAGGSKLNKQGPGLRTRRVDDE